MAFLYRRSGDLAFRGLIRKLYYMQKSPIVFRWERGSSKTGRGWRKEQGILFNKKKFKGKHFSLSWSLYTRGADSKGFLPCDIFQDHWTHTSPDMQEAELFWAVKLERQTIVATSRQWERTFPRDPWPPVFNAGKWENAPLWPIRDPVLQLLAGSTGWPFASAAWILLNGKHECRDLGGVLSVVAWKGGGGGVVPCQTLESQRRVRESHAEPPTLMCRTEHQGNTTLNFLVTSPKLSEHNMCFS